MFFYAELIASTIHIFTGYKPLLFIKVLRTLSSSSSRLTYSPISLQSISTWIHHQVQHQVRSSLSISLHLTISSTISSSRASRTLLICNCNPSLLPTGSNFSPLTRRMGIQDSCGVRCPGFSGCGSSKGRGHPWPWREDGGRLWIQPSCPNASHVRKKCMSKCTDKQNFLFLKK